MHSGTQCVLFIDKNVPSEICEMHFIIVKSPNPVLENQTLFFNRTNTGCPPLSHSSYNSVCNWKERVHDLGTCVYYFLATCPFSFSISVTRFCLRQSLLTQPKPKCFNLSSSLSLESAGISGMCHNAWILHFLSSALVIYQ